MHVTLECTRLTNETDGSQLIPKWPDIKGETSRPCVCIKTGDIPTASGLKTGTPIRFLTSPLLCPEPLYLFMQFPVTAVPQNLV